jgi:integrase
MALTIEAKKKSNSDEVVLRYSYKFKTRRYFSTGIVIPKSDLKKGVIQKPVRSSNPNAAHWNRLADQVYSKIMSIQSQLLREDKVPTADLVYELYHQNEEVELAKTYLPETTLVESFTRFLKAESYDHATEKLYRTLYAHLDCCFGNITLKGFNLDQWIVFRNYLKNKGLTANTICIRLSKFKHFLKFIKNEGIEIQIDRFPMPKEEIKQVMLDIASLQRIREFIPRTTSLQQVKDLCLFQCFTGLRISDLKRLERNHIVNNDEYYQISMRAFKTDRPQFIPLSDEAYEIMERYNFKLPELAEQYYNRQLKKLVREAQINLELEWLAYDEAGKKYYRKAKIEQVISSHACCRTAISYLERQGYSLPDVARILGKSLPTIMKYYLGRTTQSNIIETQKRIGKKTMSLRIAS